MRLNLPVIGVLCIFAFVYTTVLVCVVSSMSPGEQLLRRLALSFCPRASVQTQSSAQILPWLSYSVPGVLNLAIFSSNTGIALVCFLFCVSVDPGRFAPSATHQER